jgi:hypothetical protein
MCEISLLGTKVHTWVPNFIPGYQISYRGKKFIPGYKISYLGKISYSAKLASGFFFTVAFTCMKRHLSTIAMYDIPSYSSTQTIAYLILEKRKGIFPTCVNFFFNSNLFISFHHVLTVGFY